MTSLAGPRDGSTTFHSFSPLRSTTSTLPPPVIRARLTSASSKAGKMDSVAQVGGPAREIVQGLGLDEHDRPLALHRRHRRGRPAAAFRENARSRSVFGSLAPSSQIRTVTSGLARYRGDVARVLAEEPGRAQVADLPEQIAHGARVRLERLGRGDLPRRPVLLERDGAARALDLDAIGLVVGVRDDDLVAEQRPPSSARPSRPRRAPASPRRSPSASRRRPASPGPSRRRTGSWTSGPCPCRSTG